jgi:hypothetical protein
VEQRRGGDHDTAGYADRDSAVEHLVVGAFDLVEDA